MSRRLSKDMLALVAHLEAAVYRAVDEAMCEHECLDAEVHELIDGNVNTLNHEVDKLEAQLAQASADLDEMAEKLEAAEKARDEFEALAEKYRFALEGLKAAENPHAGELAQVKALAVRYQGEIRTAKEAESTANEFLKDAEARLDRYQVNETRLTGDIRDLQGRIATLTAELSAEKAKENDIRTLRQDCARLEIALAAEERRSASFEKDADMARAATAATSAASRDLVKVHVAAELELTETAEIVINLLNKGKNDQQIAAAINAGRPMNQQLNGPGVTAIREILMGAR